MPPILEARDLVKRYRLGAGDVEALRGVSLAVEPGEFVAFMGPSGSGKSTLLHLLGGLDRPTSGEVILDGSAISGLSDDAATRLRREKTGFVFQFFNLVPLLGVRENVALPFTIAGVDPSRGEAAERIREAIAAVDLAGTEVLESLWRSCVGRGQTIVLVTHDAKAAAYADRVYFLRDGLLRDEIVLGRRDDHGAGPLIARLAQLGL
ncbi:MAG: ABC transporter ATP-binding protein [Chloroflexi bacterium]|nr:ABC transporter ATP-binding protein [Chloroflexota bacterium]